MSMLKQHPMLSLVNNMLVDLPAPANMSYFWGFGSLLGLCLMMQMATGMFLAMHFTPHVDLAFNSVEHMMSDVNYGWLMSYAHANGASMFFMMVFIHMGRGLYYGSYTGARAMVWNVGVMMLMVMMATAFMGYVLVFGSMSLWGSVVMTNLLSAMPFMGEDMVLWVWGGYSVGNPTLNRFFSLHYLLPFVLAALAMVHLMALHEDGSNNPLGVEAEMDKLPFHPYYSMKDLFGYTLFGIGYMYLVYFDPNWLGHSDNYIPANPLVTPAHIQPEWYFLFAYAMLSSMPDKLLGVMALFGSLLVLLVVPIMEQSPIRSRQFRPMSKVLFWFFVGDFMVLTFMGGQVVEEPFVTMGQVASVFYFVYFLVLSPVAGYMEKKMVEA